MPNDYILERKINFVAKTNVKILKKIDGYKDL